MLCKSGSGVPPRHLAQRRLAASHAWLGDTALPLPWTLASFYRAGLESWPWGFLPCPLGRPGGDLRIGRGGAMFRRLVCLAMLGGLVTTFGVFAGAAASSASTAPSGQVMYGGASFDFTTMSFAGPGGTVE